MSRLTRDGTAEPVSLDQILRRERGQESTRFIFRVQLTTNRIGNLTRLIHTLAIFATIHYVIPSILGQKACKQMGFVAVFRGKFDEKKAI